MIQEENKYTNLLEDYTELQQTHEACEKEFFRIYEQNKKLKDLFSQINEIIQTDSDKRFIIKRIKNLVFNEKKK